MTPRPWFLVIRLALGLLVLGAIGWQLTIHIRLGFSAINFFSFFTNLANLFAAFVLLAGAFQSLARRHPARALDVMRGAATVYMALVGVVFSVLLRNTDLGSLRPWINVVLHYVMPVAMVLDWMIVPPRSALGTRHLLAFQIAPLLYLAYSLIRGAIVGWYPYPFLSPAAAGGYAGVAVHVIGIVLLFFAFGWLLLSLGNRRRTAIGGVAATITTDSAETGH